MSRNVCILDLQVGEMTWAKTIQPSYYVAMLSGYHKKAGDNVEFLWQPTDFSKYDFVYFIYEHPELFFDYVWAGLPNAYFFGEYSPVTPVTLPKEVFQVKPDFDIYSHWLESWLERYPTLATNKYDVLLQEPVCISTDWNYDYTDKDITIIDNNIDEWTEEQFENLSTMQAKSIRFAYPLHLTEQRLGKWLALIKVLPIIRTKLWARIDLDEVNSNNIYNFIKQYKDNYVGRYLRIRLYFGELNWDENTWWEQLEKALWVAEQFRFYTKQRLTFEIRYRETFKYPTLLTTVKRWSGSNDAYWRNSPIDYLLYDSLNKPLPKLMAYIQDPISFCEVFKNQPAQTLTQILQECPERLQGYLTKSYNMKLIPARGHPIDWRENNGTP